MIVPVLLGSGNRKRLIDHHGVALLSLSMKTGWKTLNRKAEEVLTASVALSWRSSHKSGLRIAALRSPGTPWLSRDCSGQDRSE